MAQIRGGPLSPAAADNSHPNRTATCRIIMTANFLGFLHKGKREGNVDVMESADLLYIRVRVTALVIPEIQKSNATIRFPCSAFW